LQKGRRIPTQERGKQRYDRIVAATKELVGQRGSDDVSIRDIAKLAEVAPSSIYQYFDDKNDILIAIMDAYFDQSYDWLAQHTAEAKSLGDWVLSLEGTMDFFVTLLREDPEWFTIWTGVQASPILRDYDNQDVMRSAQLLQQQLRGFCPHIGEQQAVAICVLFLQLASTTARLSLFSDEQSEESLINEYKNLIRMRIRELSV